MKLGGKHLGYNFKLIIYLLFERRPTNCFSTNELKVFVIGFTSITISQHQNKHKHPLIVYDFHSSLAIILHFLLNNAYM